MDTNDSKLMQDELLYQQRLYEYIPINAALIDHVRRLDGFNDEELAVLKVLMRDTVQKVNQQFQFSENILLGDQSTKRFLQVLLKIHQILSLVDVSYDKVFPAMSHNIREKNLMVHFQEIADQLLDKDGLNYVLRERTTDGRVFEHACDSKVLIDHLSCMQEGYQQPASATNVPKHQDDVWYFVQIIDENLSAKDCGGESEHAKLMAKYDQKILEELKIQKDKHIVLKINKSFIELAMNANGKADLYFHAYFWEQYLKSLDVMQAALAMIEKDKFDPLTQIDIFSSKYPFMKRLNGLSLTLTKVIINIKKFPFTEKMYRKYVNEFGKRQLQKKMKYLEEIQRSLFVAQIADDKEGIKWIEKLLVQLLGYPDMGIRDQAIVLLNMLYDGVDWQLLEAFRPTIRCVGQHFIINCVVHKNPKQSESQIFLGLGAPSPLSGNNFHLLTWHKVEPRNIIREDNVMFEISINFGKFWKCGFYDWRLVSISEDGKLQPLEIIGKPDPVFPNVFSYHDDYYDENQEQEMGSIAQGRFIVHARGMRDHSFHEIQIDYQDARIDKNTNQFVQRGTFVDVENSIPHYAKQGISALYLMGTLERDNYPYQTQYTDHVEYRRDDASPLAAINRCKPNQMLGGDQGLLGVMQVAKENRVKIVVDSLARISSSRHHRKYKNLLLNYLDEDGRRHICYGTDGQAQKFEDTAMLNYRKLEAWELLIEEMVTYTSKFGIDGVHLDNGQAWPQLMEPDVEELMRLDDDGEAAYSTMDFMNGEVVIRNENHGYWNSNNMETYPNPFFIKLCKRLWYEHSDFMIIGECWGGHMFEHRQIILARSGVIPRLFRLPVALSAIMGKRLFNDGRVESQSKAEAVPTIKTWYENQRKFLPDGTILMQSSTSHTLPLPAYLYGQGTWAAIDTLFFMPDLPITFMGELEGKIHKIGEVATVFQQEQANIANMNQGELRRTNSQIMRALKDGEELTNASTDHNPETPPELPEQRRGLPKVRSGVNIAAIYVEAKEGQILKRERQFQQELQPTRGFDLSKVDTHYAHRRRLRKEKMVLKYGELIMLSASNLKHQQMSEILVYARFSLSETIVIATNMSDQPQKFYLNLQNLMPTFKQAYSNNTVVIIKSILTTKDDEDADYLFLREFVETRAIKSLPAFRSLMISVTICEDDQYIFKKSLTTSIERTKKNLLEGNSVEDEQISLLFSDCVENNPTDIRRFANIIGSLQTSFLDKLNLNFSNMVEKNSKLTQNQELNSTLMAMTGYIVKRSGGQMIPPARAAQSVYGSDGLGPIVFATPELGKWSTVGGLGVMIDELSVGMAELGQEIIVISPYYHQDRKGRTDYIKADGIHYTDTMHVDVQHGCQLGIHEGTFKGVKVVFFHNADLFPCPYPQKGAHHAVYMISVFGKACLQYLASRNKIPSIFVTNDWFPGLCAAYAKVGLFGDTFKETQFVHICHNLQDTYEGRIHLDPKLEGLKEVHGLPNEFLIDPSWANRMVNPSRCAIMLSDQWGTVSKSYRDEIMNGSSLSWLLRQKTQPFAFPNGIPIKERIRKMDLVAPDHHTAKRMLQQKYFQFGQLDDSIPLFAFVGRITSQKGVHLILEASEQFIQRFDGKIQIIVGGPAQQGDGYAGGCAHKMWDLKNKFPNCFWAAPDEFFTDGSLVNRGADFALMPSAFEPGGIVQHEFFVGATPVIAFKTGGLKDSVHEFNWDTEQGSGFVFESHNSNDLRQAMERAMGTFQNKQKYFKLRENAFKATMSGEIVCKAWLGEFYRLKGKKFYNQKIIKDLESQFEPWHPSDFTPISIIQEIFGSDKNQKQQQQSYKEIDLGANEDAESDPFYNQSMYDNDNFISAFDQQFEFSQPEEVKASHTFMFPNRGPRFNRVQLCGSFDNWSVRHEMNFDHFTNQWFILMHLEPEKEYLFKYITNENNWIVNEEEPKKKDTGGNINNFYKIS